MTEQPINQKCKFCGADTIGSDVCYECLGNPERQEARAKIKEISEKPQPKQYPTYARFCDDPEQQIGFKPARVAKWLAEHEHFKTDDITDFLFYGDEEKGVWERDINEGKAKKIVTIIMGDYDTKYHFSNILHTLKSLTRQKIEFSKKVSMENGLLDLETLELTPHTLDEMPLFKYPITYDPEAKDLDDWLAFLNEVNPEGTPLLQEWMGYCFYPAFPIHAALWCFGLGRNGKGVFDRTVIGMVGKENCVHTSLMAINSRFGLKDFYGKVYHSNSEPPSYKPFNTENFKRLTGGDPIDAEFKGKNELVKFTSIAKMTLYGNKFPRIENPSVAFMERVLFTKFSKFIEVNDRVAYLENVWLNDSKKKAALFNWAMEGLQRLLSNNHFTVNQTQEETAVEFKRVSDTPNAFIDELGILDKNLVTTRNEAWNSYTEYCEAYGLDMVGKSDFTKAMQMQAPKVKDGWTRIAGKKERAWLGFGLRKLEQMEQMEQQFHTSETQQHLILNGNKNAVPSVTSVPKICGRCVDFRKQSCSRGNWQDVSGNESAVGYPCFKPGVQTCTGEHDDSADYPETEDS